MHAVPRRPTTMVDVASAAAASAANGIGNTTGASPPPNGGNLDAAAGGSEAGTRPPPNTNVGIGQSPREHLDVNLTQTRRYDHLDSSPI
jgi:hypothetical protein